MKKIRIPASEVVAYGKHFGYTDIKVNRSQDGIYIEGQKSFNGGIETVNLCTVYKMSTETATTLKITVNEIVAYGKHLGYTDINVDRSQNGVCITGKKTVSDGITETVNLCMVYKLNNIVFY
uniref:Uncharacterized protein n=1 Tax=Marseillevirus LCMAC102 TaxID=2506603 RepID=A0A481YUN5_9VIRU|nr:MAG: hypothetical protein LCMAC102_04430 [Marseillevirus LCMAC102]